MTSGAGARNPAQPHPGRTFAFRVQALAFAAALLLAAPSVVQASKNIYREGPALVMHAGAGTIDRSRLTPERERATRAAMADAMRAGWKILDQGGTSLDAVETVIRSLEDCPLFNAGKGAVFTHDGTNELDASIMDGATLRAGAVAGVRHIRNPISLARLVMERSPHVMLVGEGAEAFARSQGVPMVNPSYFYTPERWKALLEARRVEAESARARAKARRSSWLPRFDASRELGTVGVVALDRAGHLAAGTSTGGTTNKRFGRVGDSPLIGAGTYASDQSCGVSATGTGEYFIRAVVAHDIAALVEYQGLSVQAAADRVVQQKLVALHGDGGVIAMDHYGHMAFSFNTSGMYRGFVKPDGTIVTAIFRDDEKTEP
jgi:beta-aspartyl-peptidase (threonine type)